jgi:hypothetical protein
MYRFTAKLARLTCLRDGYHGDSTDLLSDFFFFFH